MSFEPWNAEQLDAVGELLVVGRDQPAVAEAEEVLRREEAERRDRPVARDVLGAERLRRVLEHRNAELEQRAHVHRAPEEMDRDDRLRPVGDLRGRVLDVEVERRGVDVGEDGGRAAPDDRLGRRVEREGRADDLVAGADAHRVERDDERVGAVRDADRALHAEVRGGLFLERPVVRRRE